MNKITREHYPASKLPTDLREGIDPKATVTVTVAVEKQQAGKRRTLAELLVVRRPPYRSAKEIDADLRAGRKERDG